MPDRNCPENGGLEGMDYSQDALCSHRLEIKHFLQIIIYKNRYFLEYILYK
jgi:hypothetical protein